MPAFVSQLAQQVIPDGRADKKPSTFHKPPNI
jgi:hypothetical protein